MPPRMHTPAEGSVFHGLAGTFDWENGHAPFTPPHNAKNAAQWRVKVGSSQYGFDYYLGFPVAGSQLSDPNVSFARNTPPNGKACWALVEWNTAAGGSWSPGSPTSFTFFNP
jgi:hypothetical protein